MADVTVTLTVSPRDRVPQSKQRAIYATLMNGPVHDNVDDYEILGKRRRVGYVDQTTGQASFTLERNSDTAKPQSFWSIEIDGQTFKRRWTANTPSTVDLGDTTWAATDDPPPPTWPDPAGFQTRAEKGQVDGYAAISSSGAVLDASGNPVGGGGGGGSGDGATLGANTFTGKQTIAEAVAGGPGTTYLEVGPAGDPKLHMLVAEASPGAYITGFGHDTLDGSGNPTTVLAVVLPGNSGPRFVVFDASFNPIGLQTGTPVTDADAAPKSYVDAVSIGVTTLNGEVTTLNGEVTAVAARVTTLEAVPQLVLPTHSGVGYDVTAGVLLVGFDALRAIPSGDLPTGNTEIHFDNPGAGRYARFNLYVAQNPAGDATISFPSYVDAAPTDGVFTTGVNNVLFDVIVTGTSTTDPTVLITFLATNQA